MIKIEENLREIYESRVFTKETLNKLVFLSRGHASGYVNVNEVSKSKIKTETLTYLINKLDLFFNHTYFLSSYGDSLNIIFNGKGGFAINESCGIASLELY